MGAPGVQREKSRLKFPLRGLAFVLLMIAGLGWWSLRIPAMRLQEIRDRLETELTESSTRADVVQLAGKPCNWQSSTAPDGTLERECVAYREDLTWLKKLTAWVLEDVLGRSASPTRPDFEVRWKGSSCLGVFEVGASWPDGAPGPVWLTSFI